MDQRPLKPAKKCIFCGGGDLSKEHIWPVWANPMINKPRAKSRLEQRFHIAVGGKSPATRLGRVTQPGDVTSKKLRVVCKRCNNTWMSRIEESAKQPLTSLIQGSSNMLGFDQQKLISTWAALKILVVEQADKAAAISDHNRLTSFMKEQLPPTGMHIWVGDCGDAHWTSAFFRSATTVTNDPSNLPPVEPDGTYRANAHYISFGIGRAFFFVFHTTHNLIKPDFRFNSVTMRNIWPSTNAIAWPPMIRMSFIQCDQIRDAYSGLVNNPPGVTYIDV